jgi:3D (Asp-Asp-Asp) domain-containing protein
MKDFFSDYILPACMIGLVIFISNSIILDGVQEKLDNQTQQIKELKKVQEIRQTVNIRTDKPVNYMYGVATAYTPSAGGINSDSDPAITSTMRPAKNGVIAVNPEVIPYGSEVMIIHKNTVIRGQAQDTGGAMRQNPKQVDILMENHQKALEWGRKDVHIIWW